MRYLILFICFVLTTSCNHNNKPSMQEADIIIKNGAVLTINAEKQIIQNGVVVIKDSKIIDVGSSSILPKYTAKTVIDAENGIIMPGMINAHTHVSMSVFRSLADDVPDRLNRYIFPLEKQLVSRDLVYKGAIHGSIEMAKSGVTTLTDMYYFEDEVAKAVKKIGLRGVLGQTVIKYPTADAETPEEAIAYAENFINEYKDDPLITPAIAPHAPHTNSEEILKKINSLSIKYNVPILIHLAETQQEYDYFKNAYNMSPVEYLDSINLLSNRQTAAHLIFIDDNDIQLLKDHDVGISHNMVANIKSAKGVSPALKMFDEKLRIGLGTDGAMSGNTLDIITQMGYVAKVHKLVNEDRSAMPPFKVVEMATIGGAKALHMDDRIGSIEKGKLADIVIVETKSPNMIPIYDYYSALVYSANPSNVETVIVNGKIIVYQKNLLTYDEEKNRQNIQELAEKINKIAETL